ncbi:MAG: hypothetical protein K6C05_03675 [Anaerovibrio sp.]|uniref:hypothetical protein n=1 Tax=Anaerovibrio sp. TaxID=1872532 RepID=UPI0026007BEC|nr:hypothetical protein [Anaerovibrio sp.]MCR5175930.1 hypothetical protein [Anaerovibrio sp.]
MFKLGVALVFAVIAALTAMVAGLLSDARLWIVLGRAFCSFIVSGVVVYIGMVLFDKLGYASAIHEIEESIEEIDKEEAAEAKQQESQANEAGDTPAEDGESVEDENFTPLQADSLRHVETDQG